LFLLPLNNLGFVISTSSFSLQVYEVNFCESGESENARFGFAIVGKIVKFLANSGYSRRLGY